MSFTFNAVELYVVIINEKRWTRAREVCKALEYDAKTSKTANIIRGHCSPENITQKCQMSRVHAAYTQINWPKDLQKFDIYTNEEGMYELLLSSLQPKAKDFKRHCCNVLLPHVRQQLTNKMKEEHQQAIKEKDATIAFLNDDLKNHKYENLGLQGEIRARDQQIAALQRRYVGYLSDEDKNNGISTITKNNDEAECPYISISGPSCYRRHKVRVLLTRNKSSTLFAD